MDTLFFFVSKLIWLIISPDSLLLILILSAFVFLFIGKQKIAKSLLAVTSGLLFVIAFFPIGEWLLYPLESHFQTNPTLPKKIDGVIVLSGAERPKLSNIWEQIEVGDAAERDLSFLTFARKYPEAKLVFTGGTGSLNQQEYKAADVAKQLFKQQGLDVSKILFERKSRNTYENIIFSKKLVNPIINEKWILITTGWHMPRSVGIFCKAGWPVIPYPVDHQTNKENLFRIDFNLLSNMSSLKTALKEWLGLFAYYLTGKTSSFLPIQCS